MRLVERVGALNTAYPLKIRITSTTRRVVVGNLIGTGIAAERGAVGEAANLAARLQAMVTPNGVLIDEPTWLPMRNIFEYPDLGWIEARGVQRLPAW